MLYGVTISSRVSLSGYLRTSEANPITYFFFSPLACTCLRTCHRENESTRDDSGVLRSSNTHLRSLSASRSTLEVLLLPWTHRQTTPETHPCSLCSDNSGFLLPQGLSRTEIMVITLSHVFLTVPCQLLGPNLSAMRLLYF